MNFPDDLFPTGWAYLAWLPYLAIVGWAIRTAPWRRLADNTQLNVWFGAIVALTLLWSLKAGVRPGLDLHLLGVTAFTLMFGRQLALPGLAVVLAAVTLNTGLKAGDAGLGWQPFALNALMLTVLPAFIAHGVLRCAERCLPANPFVYFLVGGFFGAALSMVVTGSVSSLSLWLAGVYGADLLWSDYLPFYLLLAFAEGWLNGAVITLMVVYFPKWVGSFDDRRYLWKRPPTA